MFSLCQNAGTKASSEVDSDSSETISFDHDGTPISRSAGSTDGSPSFVDATPIEAFGVPGRKPGVFSNANSITADGPGSASWSVGLRVAVGPTGDAVGPARLGCSKKERLGRRIEWDVPFRALVAAD